MQLIFLGPPGVGKGTQAIALSQRLNIPHISTGDILREAISRQSPLGIQAQAHVTAGDLVPDQLMMSLIRQRFGQPDVANGWILDGFPRTLSQAKAFDDLLSTLDQPYPKVAWFEAQSGLLIDRLLKMGRPDDTVSAIRQRLKVYREETIPLIEYYQRRQCITAINGNRTVAEVTNELSQLGIKETGAANFIKDEAEFEQLLADGLPLVVDCTATWCGPCKLVAPLMDRLADEYSDRINVFKLDLDANKLLANRFEIRSIPAVMFFKGGELKETLAGVHSYEIFDTTAARFLA